MSLALADRIVNDPGMPGTLPCARAHIVVGQSPSIEPRPHVDRVAVQRRTLIVLFVTQIISGVGAGVGASVGALLAADLAGTRVSGLAQSAMAVGAALLALPAIAIVHRRGRRWSLAACYLAAAVGSVVVVAAAQQQVIPLLFAGFFLFGGALAASLQARYAAVDLAPAALRGRHLSIVVWATTLGAVAGPNLAAFAGASVQKYGIPTLAGPFAFSAVLLALAACVLLLLMRPDPAVLARVTGQSSETQSSPTQAGMGPAVRAVASQPSARLGMAAMAVGHVVMVGVMAMTPVHIRGAGHDASHTLRIVGVVLSIHVAGMYAFSPAIGWLTDRFGRRPIILAGVGLLLAACALAGNAGHDSTLLATGLLVLGIGWSSTMVAGSTLLSESVASDLRTSAQGVSDAVMGLAGATAGALSGVVVHAWGFSMLAFVAALATTPLLLLAAQRRHDLDAT
jgi:MFS family permease